MTVFKLHSRIEKEDLEKEHAKRYGRHKGYKKGSFELGWKIQPRTPLQGRARYKWGSLKDFYPPNLANPLTCRIPSLIDFLETRQPKYFFYTLEDWDFKNDHKFPVEKELVCKAIMYWRLMLFTRELDESSSKIVNYYLNTANKIISNRMPIFGYWPYRNGLVHYYNSDKNLKTAIPPFIIATIISIIIVWILEKKIPMVPLIGGIFISFFGGLTIYFNNPVFIYIKPTIINILFGLALIFGKYFTNEPVLKKLMGKSISLTNEGWEILNKRWIYFFFGLAILNELVWRTQSEEFWVNFKVWGLLPITFIFTGFQIGLINKYKANEQ